jgi:hydroxymethylbilane synthase
MPAGQGAIVAETNPDNLAALNLLKAIGDAVLTKGIQQERIYAEKYGYGCSQQFGVFHWQGGGMPFTFASGTDSTGKTFSEWDFHLPPTAAAYHWLDTTKFMKDFFRYEYPDTIIPDHYAGYFVASHKAVHNPSAVALLHKKRVWVAGTRTWRELAARGIWVEGCADGLGMETLTRLLHTPLIDLPDMHVLTNTDSAQTRIAEGHSATGTYILIPAISPALVAAITGAEAIFWSSFRQYASFAHLLPRGIPQACAAGKTADALRAAGVRPIVFPTLKAFQEWQQQYVLLPVGE